MSVDWSKAGQFASFCFQAHLAMQHMEQNKNDRDDIFPELLLCSDGSGHLQKPSGEYINLGYFGSEHGDPFKLIKDYFSEHASSLTSELKKFINERLEVADDRAYDLEYKSEASYYFGRINAFRDVLAFINSKGTLVE